MGPLTPSLSRKGGARERTADAATAALNPNLSSLT
jgi:hypothetical protein